MKKAAEFLALNFFWTKQLKPILDYIKNNNNKYTTGSKAIQ